MIRPSFVQYAIAFLLCVALIAVALFTLEAKLRQIALIEQEDFIAAPRGIEHF